MESDPPLDSEHKSILIYPFTELESGSLLIKFFPIQYTGDEAKVVELAKEKGL